MLLPSDADRFVLGKLAAHSARVPSTARPFTIGLSGRPGCGKSNLVAAWFGRAGNPATQKFSCPLRVTGFSGGLVVCELPDVSSDDGENATRALLRMRPFGNDDHRVLDYPCEIAGSFSSPLQKILGGSKLRPSEMRRWVRPDAVVHVVRPELGLLRDEAKFVADLLNGRRFDWLRPPRPILFAFDCTGDATPVQRERATQILQKLCERPGRNPRPLALFDVDSSNGRGTAALLRAVYDSVRPKGIRQFLRGEYRRQRTLENLLPVDSKS